MRSIRILFSVVIAVLFIAGSVAAKDTKSNQINCFHNNRTEDHHHHCSHKNKKKHHHCSHNQETEEYLYDDFNDDSPDMSKWAYADCGWAEEDGKLKFEIETSSCTNTSAMFIEVPTEFIEADLNVLETTCGDTTLNDCGVGAAISAVWFMDPDSGNYFWTTIGLAIFDNGSLRITVGSYQWNPNTGAIVPGESNGYDNINGIQVSKNTEYTLRILKDDRIVKFYANDIELFHVNVPEGFESSHNYNSALAGLNSYILGNSFEKSIVTTYDNVYAK